MLIVRLTHNVDGTANFMDSTLYIEWLARNTLCLFSSQGIKGAPIRREHFISRRSIHLLRGMNLPCGADCHYVDRVLVSAFRAAYAIQEITTGVIFQ